MELRALVVALVAICNFAAETLEKLLSEDGDGKETRAAKPARSRPSRAKKEEKEDDDKDDDDDKDGDEPSEDDIVDAVRAAQKVLEKADITKILKKHGKAERATEVEPEHRQAVIDALEKAVDAA
jgi:hypothetical protein